MSRATRSLRSTPPRLEPLEPRTLFVTIVSSPGLQRPPPPPLAQVVAAHGRLLLVNEDGVHGHELWRSDGTPQGTTLVKDIYPGEGGSLDHNPRFFTIGAATYFTVSDPDHGLELWRTDGTPAGTRLVKDLAPGPDDAHVAQMTDVNGQLYFTTSVEGRHRLWKSDGTAAGTALVADLGDNHVQEIVPVGNTVFLTRQPGGDAPIELWRTTGGTPALARVALPDGVQIPWHRPKAVNGRLLLVGDASARVFALDPATSAFTTVADFDASLAFGTNTLTPARVVGGKLYFTKFMNPQRRHAPRTEELWVTDGTAGGTRQVWSAGRDRYGNLERAGTFAAAGGLLYFTANDDGAPVLWRTDGTVAGTRRVGNLDRLGGEVRKFVTLGGALFFTDQNALWRSDGTPAGTAPLSALPGPVADVATLGARIVVRADTHASEYWTFDAASARRRFRHVPVPLTPNVRVRAGHLRVRGATGRGDAITLTADPAANTLRLDLNGVSLSYPLASITSVGIEGGAGGDTVTLAGPVPRATLSGGDGNDALTGGDADDVLHGDDGDDRLRGGGGNDDLFGDAGADVLDGGAGGDVLSGGRSGEYRHLVEDTADYSARTRAVTVSADGRNRDGERNERDNVLPDVEIIRGGAGDDTLIATATATAVAYGYLRIQLFGNDGDDTLTGGDAGDGLHGGAGNDLLQAGTGNDTLFGGDGDDTLYGNEDDDVLDGGAGVDALFGGPGADYGFPDRSDKRTSVELR
jgi:ELWxxDGT repeat protein